jgi:hypothetical protein
MDEIGFDPSLRTRSASRRPAPGSRSGVARCTVPGPPASWPCSSPPTRHTVTRYLRFLAEYCLATAVSAAIAGALLAGANPAQLSAEQGRSGLALLIGVGLEWVVMRRHFRWGNQWAFANLAAISISSIVSSLARWTLPATLHYSLLTALTAILSQSLPQWAVLSSRTRRAWVWLFVPPATWLLGGYARQALGLQATGGHAAHGIQFAAVGVATAVLAAAILAWLCRDELSANPTWPTASASRRREFLLGWIAAHALALDLTTWVAAFVGERSVAVLVGLVVYAGALIGGTLTVLSTTKEDRRRWVVAPAVAATGWILSAFTPLFILGYYLLLATKWTAVGFSIAIGQWFGVRRSWRGLVWLGAALLGWSSSIWIPLSFHAVVGPANTWRYPVGEPTAYYVVAGLATGLAYIWASRREGVFAS